MHNKYTFVQISLNRINVIICIDLCNPRIQALRVVGLLIGIQILQFSHFVIRTQSEHEPFHLSFPADEDAYS